MYSMNKNLICKKEEIKYNNIIINKAIQKRLNFMILQRKT